MASYDLDGPPFGATGDSARYSRLATDSGQSPTYDRSDNASGGAVGGLGIPSPAVPLVVLVAGLLIGIGAWPAPIDATSGFRTSGRMIGSTEQRRLQPAVALQLARGIA